LIVGGGSIGVDNFNVGNGVGSSSSHTLGSGESISAGNENIGNFGTGAFTQTGGTKTVTNTLALGRESGSSGTYHLSGGSISADSEYLGGSG
jgi:hypothetical protein